jgi:ribosomal protein S18 acetylase RimI-like enzyme
VSDRDEEAWDAAALAVRQARSQRGFFRALASGSADSSLIELDRLQGTAVPARPWFSMFNSAFYEEPAALENGREELGAAYAQAGVKAWSVWVPPEDEATSQLLAADGFKCEASPLRMAAPLAEIDLEPQQEIDLVGEPTWEMVARCNDRAHGVPEDWTLARAFDAMDDPASHLHAARFGEDVGAVLIAREHDGDCYLWGVATAPEAQRRGLGAELLRVALGQARDRGAQTTSLESTAAGERLYTKLGYRPLGRFGRWATQAA